MNRFQAKDLMVPLSEYATVQKGATLLEAVLTLEKIQAEYDHTKYRHLAVMVLDKDRQVVGRVGHVDVLNAVASCVDKGDLPSYNALEQFGFSSRIIRTVVDERLWQHISIKDLCRKASRIKVEQIMQAPTQGEYVEADTPIEQAIEQMVEGSHFALLVAREKRIVGILRMSDIFAAVFHSMKECQTPIP